MRAFDIPNVTPDTMPQWEIQGKTIAYQLAKSLTHQTQKVPEAIVAHRLALALDPTLIQSMNQIVMLLDGQPGKAAQAMHAREEWWTRFGARAYAERQPHTNDPDPDRVLRIGYVSSDFRHHSAVLTFSAAIFMQTQHFVPVCYSSMPKILEDAVTTNFKERTEWHEVWHLNNRELAEQIRRDRIDILVDLSGYTVGNRLLTFAYKPAPIQVTAFGYATGVGWPEPAMDALFADAYVAETATIREPLLIELPSVISLVGARLPYMPDVTPLPCLTQPPLFGAFHQVRKLNTEVLHLWARVLEGVPDATLLFKGSGYSRGNVAWIRREMASVADRLQFGGETPHGEHLKALSHVDLVLDTFPQTGGVSTLEAAILGVPTMTLVNDSIIQRTSGSIMSQLGLAGCIAQLPDQFVEKAVAMVTAGKEELAWVRARLRKTVLASPLCQGYQGAIESAYRQLWHNWCEIQSHPDGERSDDFDGVAPVEEMTA